ncbi:MAG: hypothetical protein M3466_00495 [Gemmatimonadota bacterium]|nr:hypothetical protein [Gemmatimonadota bacterium]
MPGRLETRTWRSDPTIDAPAVYKRACKYHTFVPDELSSLDIRFDTSLAGLVSEAEHAVRQLNDQGGAALDPLARLLLRTESIASSKVEGMQIGVRELARAEARAESGLSPGTTAMEVLANIDAMVLAVDEAANAAAFSEAEITASTAGYSSVHRMATSRGASEQGKTGSAETTKTRAGRTSYRRLRRKWIA